MLAPIKQRAIRQLAAYDYMASAVAWIFFWAYRHSLLDNIGFFDALRLLLLRDYIFGLIIIPCGWLFLYLLSGTYFDLYRKSRLNEINRTLISCILGCIFISLI